MNELHLKYQQDTGIQVSKQVESLHRAFDFSREVRCPECNEKFSYCPERDLDCPDMYEYIQWLEEQIKTNEKNKETERSKHYRG